MSRLFDEAEPNKEPGRRERNPQSTYRPIVTASGVVSEPPQRVQTRDGEEAVQIVVALDRARMMRSSQAGNVAIIASGDLGAALGHGERGWQVGDAVMFTFTWLSPGPWRDGRPQGPEVFLADRTKCLSRAEEFRRGQEKLREAGFDVEDEPFDEQEALDVTPRPTVNHAAKVRAAERQALAKKARGKKRRRSNAGTSESDPLGDLLRPDAP